MREIKFRGFQKSWIYGGISVFENEATIFDIDCVANSAYEVDIKSIGQYTGLKDKNGVEIYEGDIIKNERGDWGVVVIKDHCFEVTVSEDQSSLYTKEYYNNSEVIGNTYENPDLLTI